MFSHDTLLWSFTTTQLWSTLKWPFCHNGISDLECLCLLVCFNVWLENKKVQVSYSFWNLNAVVEVSPAVSHLWLPGPEVEGQGGWGSMCWLLAHLLRRGGRTVHPLMWHSHGVILAPIEQSYSLLWLRQKNFWGVNWHLLRKSVF